jgi:amino acid permease
MGMIGEAFIVMWASVAVVIFVIATVTLFVGGMDMHTHMKRGPNYVTDSDKKLFRNSLIGLVGAPFWPLLAPYALYRFGRRMWQMAKVAWS